MFFFFLFFFFWRLSELIDGKLKQGGITAKPKGGLWTTLEEVPGW